MATALELATMTPQGVYREVEALAKQVEKSMYGLCKLADVDPTTVQLWKNGEGDPSFRIVRKLLKQIEVIRGELEAKQAGNTIEIKK